MYIFLFLGFPAVVVAVSLAIEVNVYDGRYDEVHCTFR